MAANASESTLIGSEKRFAPAVLVVHYACMVAGLLLLSFAVLHSPSQAWMPCAVLWIALTVSNMAYLPMHERPTVGMAPVSVASLGPAALAALLAPNNSLVIALLLGVVVGIAVLVCVFFAWWFWRLRRTYAHAPAPKADAALIVLGSSVKDGRPRKTLMLRLDVAQALAIRHPNMLLVLTGGTQPDEQASEAEVMCAYLAERSVPVRQMLLERQARNTRQNIELSMVLLQTEGQARRQACVVSSDYHLYRALDEARRLGLELVPVAAPTPRAGRLQQWCREVLTIVSQRLWERKP